MLPRNNLMSCEAPDWIDAPIFHKMMNLDNLVPRADFVLFRFDFTEQGPLWYMWPLQASVIQKDGASYFLIYTE